MEIVWWIIGSVLSGGVAVALINGWVSLRLNEVKALREDVKNMRAELDGWREKYFDVLAKYKTLESVSNTQADEITRLTSRIAELEEYKNQYRILSRLRKALSDFHSNGDHKKLIECLEKELLK